ncbi:Transmembrane protein 11 [Mactra antiquata]
MAVTTARSRPGAPPEYVVIPDVENGDYSMEDFENELEKALDDHAEIIVIEQKSLGDETARWIKVGNCLHKVGVVSGVISSLYQCIDGSKTYIVLSCGIVSVLCASVYAISWQNDPCCKYQVDDSVERLEKVIGGLQNLSPVVLVRRDDTRRKKLHNFIALLSGIICAVKFYKMVRS